MQDLRGRWQGGVEASGGAGGPLCARFDVQGSGWQWGSLYSAQSVWAVGDFDSTAGVKLDKLQVDSEDTSLSVSGQLLGPKQDAKFDLLQFPAPMVQPLAASLMAVATGSPPPSAHARSTGAAGAPRRSAAGLLHSDAPPIISGKLYVQGKLGGSASQPQCNVLVRLLDGAALGVTKLGTAEASIVITESQRVEFHAQLSPTFAPGKLEIEGAVPLALTGLDSGGQNGNGGNGALARLGRAADTSLKLDATVKDSGMDLLFALVPQLRWQHGNADMKLMVRGTAAAPSVDGVAHLRHGTITCPFLPRPLTHINASVKITNNALIVESLDGRMGRNGHLKASRPPSPAHCLQYYYYEMSNH